MVKLLVAGIDPGTTLGYAVMDFDGDVLDKGSSKLLNMGTLIAKTKSYGNILIVGCDKAKVPSFVNNFAVKVGAKVIAPKNDLSVIEKKELTKNFDLRNSHEMDALASCLNAYKKIKPLLDEIDAFLEKGKKEHLSEKVKEIVIKKNFNMRLALSLADKPEKEEKETIREVIEEKKPEGRDITKVYKKLKEYENENKIIKEQKKRLINELEAMKRKYDYLEKKISQLKPDERFQKIIDIKNENIGFLMAKIKILKSEIEEARQEINNLYTMLSENEAVILKRIKNLGWNELTFKNTILKINAGDILIVDDTNIISEKTIDFLKGKVNIIVYKGKLNKNLRDFIFINFNELNIKENRYFAVADKKELQKKVKSRDMLKRIIEDYRSS